ncbi:MAG: nitrate/nitrite transporter NrtS [Acidimicrobiia bacterium]
MTAKGHRETDRVQLRAQPPTWSTWAEAARVVLHPPHLGKTVAIALVVGTVLFCINQLDVVLRGDATAVVWLKSGVTYLVPFCVSNAGVLVASRVDRRADS